MPTRNKISPKVWATIRFEWQSGQHTFKELAEQYGIAESTIKERSMIQAWKEEKPLVVARIEQKQAETIEEMFVQAGLPRAERVRLIVDGIRNSQRIYYLGHGEDMTARYIPDYLTRLRYLEYAGKLCRDEQQAENVPAPILSAANEAYMARLAKIRAEKVGEK